MASDLSALPITGNAVVACGDAHVKNFAVCAPAERNLIFAIDDYDEVYVSPWEWDLKGLAASAAVAVQCPGGNKVECEEASRECVRIYREREISCHPLLVTQGEWPKSAVLSMDDTTRFRSLISSTRCWTTPRPGLFDRRFSRIVVRSCNRQKGRSQYAERPSGIKIYSR